MKLKEFSLKKNSCFVIAEIGQAHEGSLGLAHSYIDAVAEAGRVRLRPILMTAFTTSFGLIPMALGIGAGNELRAPMARSVIGGLMLSTFLTLVFIPVIYTLFEKKKKQAVEEKAEVVKK